MKKILVIIALAIVGVLIYFVLFSNRYLHKITSNPNFGNTPQLNQPTVEELANGFINPPNEARPNTFWHWMNGNVTKEGITADLEAMEATGIGGVMLFFIEGEVTESGPEYVENPVHTFSPEWFAMVRHAATECKRLGLTLSLMNCTGWATSGGPWMTPDKSMMRIAWSEKYFKGPGKIGEALPQPPSDYACYQNLLKHSFFYHESVPPEQQFYHDVAVLAYRLDSSAARTAALWPPKLSCSASKMNTKLAVDGDGETVLSIEKGGFLQFDFNEQVTVRGVEYLGANCELLAGDEVNNLRKVADIPGPRALGYPQTLPVPETKARYFLLSFIDKGEIKDVKLSGESLLLDYQPKASFHGYWEDSQKAEDRIGSPTPEWASATVKSDEIIDLSHLLKEDGTLDWDAPEGDWMIVRIGCASIGRLNGPSSKEYRGLECNKLDKDAVEYHFNQYAGKVINELEDLIGTGFHSVHVDSWEAGDLNFTPKFIEEFEKRRGYDPTPFLLVHGSGRVVDSPEISDRFLWDVRRTIADLLAENYYGHMKNLCHKHGLKFHGEIAGFMIQTTIDQLQVKKYSDPPTGEFWLGGNEWAEWDLKEVASGAHIHGKPIVAAEAFTTFARWMTDPYGMKASGDFAFTKGINELDFHTWAHHPWADRAPGMTMGPFGVNFSRMNTWWGEPAEKYFEYLKRCQYMLRQGTYVADILYFYGEGAPNTLPHKSLLKPILPNGYSYDGCDAETLISRMKVKDGQLILPNGMSYSVLVLKEDSLMTPELLIKIKDLIKAGATVIGQKPKHSPSLKNYPKCDEIICTISDEIWGNNDDETFNERTFGKGRIVWGASVEEVLKSKEIVKDVEIIGDKVDNTIEWIHRRTKDSEIYFISNQKNFLKHGSSPTIWEKHYDSFAINELKEDVVNTEVAFRVTGKQPELWDAVTGVIRELPEFRVENGQTIIPIELPPSGSCFIVFRDDLVAQPKPNRKKNFPVLKTVAKLEGSWDVAFDPKWGGPGQVTFNVLNDWTENSDPGVKYYSGRATYKKIFNVEPEVLGQKEKIYLDLGKLRNLAEIRLNGENLGVLWCPPWSIEVTDLLKPENNILEVDIINIWANRLIGDAALPKDERFTWTSLSDTRWALKPDDKLIPSGLYGPVKLCTEQN